MVHRREIDGNEIVLGNQGALWGNAMTWWDHETGSVWSQPLGEAIAGELKGTKLKLLSSTLTTWEAWLEAHPRTLAIDTFGYPLVVDLDDMAIVVDLGLEAVAYDYSLVREQGIVNDVVAGVEVAVVVDPADERRWAVFSRRLDDRVVNLGIVNGKLVDEETGAVFDPVRGHTIGRPGLTGNLDLLGALTVFPADFRTFWPDGRIWMPGTQ